MRQKIIVINGLPASGKDTFVSLFQKHYSAINWSTIDPIKELARKCGWDGEKTPAARKLLSSLKQLLNEFNDFSYKKTKETIETFMNTENEYLFIHCREPDEIKRMVRDFNVYTLLISRDSKEPISNSSDADVYKFPNYDFCIENNGTLEELEQKAIEFANQL